LLTSDPRKKAMIESIEFTNFKALRRTTLPLAPFTLLLGPNGSGKTSVLQALQEIVAVFTPPNEQGGLSHASMLSITARDRMDFVGVKLRLRLSMQSVIAEFKWHPNGQSSHGFLSEDGRALKPNEVSIFAQWINRMQIYSLDASAIAQPSAVSAGPLRRNGAGLAAVLDDLKDNHPDRWEALLAEMHRWIPEYDYIMFDKPEAGKKAIALRTKKGRHRISAQDLSQGTLIALALLTLAYMPNPPSLVGLEEIDRGLHPRLLRHLQDALYRLSYPENCGESRPAIQVIATTHSPYLLDLYREHPEEIVLAEKEGLEVQMKRLTDIEHYDEILGDSPLSEVWYSGVLGGVSVKP
jgi:predicted ATPase